MNYGQFNSTPDIVNTKTTQFWLSANMVSIVSHSGVTFNARTLCAVTTKTHYFVLKILWMVLVVHTLQTSYLTIAFKHHQTHTTRTHTVCPISCKSKSLHTNWSYRVKYIFKSHVCSDNGQMPDKFCMTAA